MEEKITDRELSQICQKISVSAMKSISRRYLGIENAVIESLTAKHREDVDSFKFQCLEIWRNNNPGRNFRSVRYIVATHSQC